MNKTCEACIHCDCCDYWEEEVYILDEYDRHICSKFNNKDDYQKAIYAKWIEDGYENILACSHCGVECNYKEILGFKKEYTKTPYCSYCGAKMDLE